MAKSKRVAISIEMDWGFKRHLEVYAGCQKYADEVGWECNIHPAPDRAINKEPENLPFDGIIARVTKPIADAAQRVGIPLVNVWLNSPVQGLPGVFVDHSESGRMAAEHLLGRGFQNFGYLGYQRDIDSRLQLSGFRGVTRREGYRCTTHRFSRTSVGGKALGWENFIAGLGDWIETWKMPIGIYVTQDTFSRYLIEVCRSMGLHVSENVAIVSTSNEREICDAPSPTLTSIDLGYAQIGYRAAAILDRLMDGEPPPEEPELLAPAELIPRQSTDSSAADDPLVARALRYISERGNNPMQVKDVAAAVATTRRTLERRFRESVGRSIGEEITRLRLERAKRRLVETDAPMKDIAEDAGFRAADHFYKVFARVEGIPPSQYRNERQKVFHEREE